MIVSKEIINYLVFGILTTLVNIITFWFCEDILSFDYKLATTIAWIISVIFAFITNKLYVFNSKDTTPFLLLKELASFLFFRLLSYFLDIFSMILLIEYLNINSIVAKVIANIFVVVFNYFASKLIIFNKHK